MPLAPVGRGRQIDAVLGDIGADAIKIGMLATRGIAVAVAHALARHPPFRVVLDPVMVAKGGARLLDEDAVADTRGAPDSRSPRSSRPTCRRPKR